MQAYNNLTHIDKLPQNIYLLIVTNVASGANE